MTRRPLVTPSKASTTIKRKSLLMNLFMLTYEKLTAPQRITIELIRSAEWKRMRDEYVKLWMPVLIAHESDKAGGKREGNDNER